jgi:hypothetical protein
LRDGKLRTFHNALRTNGVDVATGEPTWVYDDRDTATSVIDPGTQAVDEKIVTGIIGNAKKKAGADIVLVILSQADESTYNAVKRAGDVIHGKNIKSIARVYAHIRRYLDRLCRRRSKEIRHVN